MSGRLTKSQRKALGEAAQRDAPLAKAIRAAMGRIVALESVLREFAGGEWETADARAVLVRRARELLDAGGDDGDG